MDQSSFVADSEEDEDEQQQPNVETQRSVDEFACSKPQHAISAPETLQNDVQTIGSTQCVTGTATTILHPTELMQDTIDFEQANKPILKQIESEITPESRVQQSASPERRDLLRPPMNPVDNAARSVALPVTTETSVANLDLMHHRNVISALENGDAASVVPQSEVLEPVDPTIPQRRPHNAINDPLQQSCSTRQEAPPQNLQDHTIAQEPMDATNGPTADRDADATTTTTTSTSSSSSSSSTSRSRHRRLDDQEQGLAQDTSEQNGDQVLRVGEEVFVDARTWPGINKLGGAGRVAKVHHEVDANGQTVVLYDVRYIFGGCEKRIEAEFVHASNILTLQKQPRGPKPRQFYHDEMDKEERTRRQKLLFGKSVVPSVMTSQDKSNETAPSTVCVDSNGTPQEPGVDHVKESLFPFDEESSEEEKEREDQEQATNPTAPERTVQKPKQRRVQRRDLSNENELELRRKKRRRSTPSHQEDYDFQAHSEPREPKRKRRHKRSRARYVGGYLHSGEDADARFIQPEDDAMDLPQDVLQATGFRLATTLPSLRKQLKSQAQVFEQRMNEFKTEKPLLERLLESAAGDDTALDECLAKARELERMLEKRVVYWENIVDRILSEIDSRASLEDNPYDLAHSQRKEVTSEWGRWINGVLDHLEELYRRKGRNLPVMKPTTSDLSSSDDSDDDDDDDEEEEEEEEEEKEDSESESGDENSGSLDSPGSPLLDMDFEPSFIEPSSPFRSLDTSGRRSYKRKRSANRFSYEEQQQGLLKYFNPSSPSARFNQFQKSTTSKTNVRILSTSARGFTGTQEANGSSDSRWNWLNLLLKKNDRARAALHHRLPARMLANSRQDFSKSNKVMPRKGKQPWSLYDPLRKLRAQRGRQHELPLPPQPTMIQPTSLLSSSSRPSKSGLIGSSSKARSLSLRDTRFVGGKRDVMEEEPAPMTLDKDTVINELDRDAPSETQWDVVFEVTSCVANLETSEITINDRDEFLQLGIFYDEPSDLMMSLSNEEEEDLDMDMEWTAMGSRPRANQVVMVTRAIREDLTTLRVKELDLLQQLVESSTSDEKSMDDMDADVFCSQNDQWRHLQSLADQIHVQLLHLVKFLRKICVVQLLDTDLIHQWMKELQLMLSMLPTCGALFGGGCTHYFYFFDVLFPTKRSTPMLLSICRVFWYVLMLTCHLHQAMGVTASSNSSSTYLTIQKVISSAMAFLMDLQLHFPASLEPSDASPAVSLWLLLYKSFVQQKFPKHVTALSDSRDFWALLTLMYRDGFMETLARTFVRGEMLRGYLDPQLGHEKPTYENALEEKTTKLLALDSIWDLLVALARLVRSLSEDKDINISSLVWTLASGLLHPENGFLPFRVAIEAPNAAFGEVSGAFIDKVLSRILALSICYDHESEFVKKTISTALRQRDCWSLTDDASNQSPVQLCDLLVKPNCLAWLPLNAQIQFLQLLEKEEIKTDTCELLCRILMTQFLKAETLVARNRFRQPILQSIAELLVVVSEPEQAPVQPENKWNWHGAGSCSTSASVSSVTQPAVINPLQHFEQRELVAVSLLLSMALGACFAHERDSRAFASRQNDPKRLRLEKNLARDIRYYCNEMGRHCAISTTATKCGILFAQALLQLGHCMMQVSNDAGFVFKALNEHITEILRQLREQQARRQLAAKASKESQRLQQNVESNSMQIAMLKGGARHSIDALFDLTRQLHERCNGCTDSSLSRPIDLELFANCAPYIVNSGLAACIETALDSVIPLCVLHQCLEMISLVMPREFDSPARSAPLVQVQEQQLQPFEDRNKPPTDDQEFYDEFDDPEMENILASMDVDTASRNAVTSNEYPYPSQQSMTQQIQTQASYTTVTPSASCHDAGCCRETLYDHLHCHLRVALQKLLLHAPLKKKIHQDEAVGETQWNELIALDLLGEMMSSCRFQFGWNLTRASLTTKNPFLAPRLLSSALKYNHEKQWFSTCFLSEPNADQQLVAMWVLATLDLKALSPDPLKNTHDAPRSCLQSHEQQPSLRYSDYWMVLSDSIVFEMLRPDDTVLASKTDPWLLHLLRTAAHFAGSQVIKITKPCDTALVTIMDLFSAHLRVFQGVCRGVGEVWKRLDTDRLMDQKRVFRHKMLDLHSGVFLAFVEAYEANLKSVFQVLQAHQVDWYAMANHFLAEFDARNLHSKYHEVDEDPLAFRMDLQYNNNSRRLQSTEVIRQLVVFFRFMYASVDAFLFYCGEMAIGTQNIFLNVIELMFRQAICPEYPRAAKKILASASSATTSHSTSSFQQLRFQQTRNHSHPQQTSNASSACTMFVENTRLFFARQKYPSLLFWFAQTAETYQTLQNGWPQSPLRVLLLNMLDPDGPLGIESYYRIDDQSEMIQPWPTPLFIRREAYYLSCGLFRCECAKSYHHTASSKHDFLAISSESQIRHQALRRFVLREFMREMLSSLEMARFREELLPLLQFWKAFVHHLCLQTKFVAAVGGALESMMNDMVPCLQSIGQVFGFQPTSCRILDCPLNCVVLIELGGLVEQLIKLSVQTPVGSGENAQFTQLIRQQIQFFRGLSGTMRHANPLLEELFPAVFAREEEPIIQTNASCGPLLVSPLEFDFESAARERVDYGLNVARTQADLLCTIRRIGQASATMRIQEIVPGTEELPHTET